MADLNTMSREEALAYLRSLYAAGRPDLAQQSFDLQQGQNYLPGVDVRGAMGSEAQADQRYWTQDVGRVGDPNAVGNRAGYRVLYNPDGTLRDVVYENADSGNGADWFTNALMMAAAGAIGAGAAGYGPLGGFSGTAPAGGAAAGGVSAADIAAAAGQPELGMASQVGAGGSNWLTSALRLAPLAGLALGGKPSLPNPPATDPQANIDAQIKSINDLFATDKRAPIYQQVYNDSYGLQSNRLDENRQDALRKLRFGLARSGLTSGSADVSAHGLEQREFGRALSDASTAAQGQADQVRANDEKTRLNLIAQMRAGLDSADATQSALTQMADNANAARAQTRYDALDSYMGAVAPTINNFQVRSGQQAAQQLYNTRFPQNRISLSGRSGTIVG
jgi:hypothetical protein